MSTPDKNQNLAKKNARIGITVLVVVAGMVGLSFASVPLYTMFCKVTGYGGTTQVSDALPDNVVDRTVTVKFNAETARGMPWDFTPDMREIKVRLGERGLTSFSARNKRPTPTTGTAIYNVTPLKAGKYFHKIQCFCFDEQTLQGGEQVSMPVLFFVDPSMNDDPNMDDVKVITLSYTFFETQSKALEDALEGFYNDETGGIKTTH
ncbi:MAG: cytochrome c oxidase assembly protein [Alphaproteobacteria bacterium]|nr:cytochrome c oxidase assembly protein [Alphaproteobacteria bacterium]